MPTTPVSTADLARMIAQGRGTAQADLVVKGGRILDLVTGDLTVGDVAICGDRIVGTPASIAARARSTRAGRSVVPGFIDTHLHVESSLVHAARVRPLRAAARRHHGDLRPARDRQRAGAGGRRAISSTGRWRPSMDLRVQLSSCVPATDLETSGARLEAADLLPLAEHEKVIGLAEFMNFPGVLHADPGALAKLAAFQGGHIDGHAPLLRGRDLNGYLAAGIRTDHEATSRGGGAGEAGQGHDDPDARGLGVQGPARAGAADHARPRAVHRVLHRRPQPARHRRGGPSRLRDPHGDQAGRAPARRLPRPRSPPRAPSGCATAAWSRRAGAPTSCCSTISKAAPSRR